MALSFQNMYTETVYVSLLWFDQGCNPDPWRKIGWFGVTPGTTINIVNTDLTTLQEHQYAWFADTGADGPCWSGDHWYKVPHNAAFNQCYDDDTGCNALVPFVVATLDQSWYGFTIMLLAPGNANQTHQGCVWGNIQYPPLVQVPNVIGLEVWQARNTLRDVGFSSDSYCGGDPCTGKQQGSRVDSTNPAPSSMVPPGSTVTINASY